MNLYGSIYFLNYMFDEIVEISCISIRSNFIPDYSLAVAYCLYHTFKYNIDCRTCIVLSFLLLYSQLNERHVHIYSNVGCLCQNI